MSAGLDATQLAMLSHELRGALTVIRGLNDLLRSGLPPEQQASALEGIDRAVMRMNALIESARDGEARANSAGWESVDLTALSTGIVEEQRAITGREIRFDGQEGLSVNGDLNALSRALANVIDNALKYSFAKHPVEVRVYSDGASAIIDVADRGPGIPEECRAVVFQPFERLGRDEDIPGTGLGLAVVSSVAESHGGTAIALERAGGGALVRLVLPRAGS